ncbi:hypothetical protein BJX70DRAFT_399612 [Aspergillus crustosus]
MPICQLAADVRLIIVPNSRRSAGIGRRGVSASFVLRDSATGSSSEGYLGKMPAMVFRYPPASSCNTSTIIIPILTPILIAIHSSLDTTKMAFTIHPIHPTDAPEAFAVSDAAFAPFNRMLYKTHPLSASSKATLTACASS